MLSGQKAAESDNEIVLAIVRGAWECVPFRVPSKQSLEGNDWSFDQTLFVSYPSCVRQIKRNNFERKPTGRALNKYL